MYICDIDFYVLVGLSKLEFLEVDEFKYNNCVMLKFLEKRLLLFFCVFFKLREKK